MLEYLALPALVALIFGAIVLYAWLDERAKRRRVTMLWIELTINTERFAAAMNALGIATDEAGERLAEFGRALAPRENS